MLKIWHKRILDFSVTMYDEGRGEKEEWNDFTSFKEARGYMQKRLERSYTKYGYVSSLYLSRKDLKWKEKIYLRLDKDKGYDPNKRNWRSFKK